MVGFCHCGNMLGNHDGDDDDDDDDDDNDLLQNFSSSVPSLLWYGL